MKIEAFKIIDKYADKNSSFYEVFLIHSIMVAQKSIKIAKKLSLLEKEIVFIKEAALLHDIGSFYTLKNNLPYICHGLWGEKFLLEEGLKRHASVAKNHIGVGLSKETIQKNNFPLPKIDMCPQNIYEEIITYSDLFFSKSKKNPFIEREISEVWQKLSKYGDYDLKIFDSWLKKFEDKNIDI